MAGVAQVWLTHAELDALLRAAFDTKVKVSGRLEDALRDKLLTAFAGVACAPAVEVHSRDKDAWPDSALESAGRFTIT